MNESRQIAILAHELQHTLEVAENADVVDLPGFALAYERLGFKRRHFPDGGTGFDARAAVVIGRMVGRELAATEAILETRYRM